MQETEEFKVKMEYTTRPQRRKAVGTGAEDSYHFVKEELYLNSLKDKVLQQTLKLRLQQVPGTTGLGNKIQTRTT